MVDVFVLGSYVNANSLVVKQLPKAGESLQAEALWTEHGGKGLNLAVGMHRLGLRTYPLIAVGNDTPGDALMTLLRSEGLEIQGVVRTSIPSGFGVGLVTAAGDNIITIYPGANAQLSIGHVQTASNTLQDCRLVCAQFEIPDAPIVEAFKQARQRGIKTLLNPSPWRESETVLLSLTDILVLNETEAAACFGITDVDTLSLAQWLRLLPVLAWKGELLVVTLAERGCVALQRGQEAMHEPAWTIEPVDPTGAGDAFATGLAYALLNDYPLVKALRFANACGAMIASQQGVLQILPTWQQVGQFMGDCQRNRDIHPLMLEVMGNTKSMMEQFGLHDLASENLEALRRFQRACCPASENLPFVCCVEDHHIPTKAGTLAIRLYKPSLQPNLPMLVWFHGGGWVMGGLDSAEWLCRSLANRVGCAVVSIDYRLAPEYPFPCALDDGLTVVQWLETAASDLGLGRGRMAVGGDSAGGNLAACMTHQLQNSRNKPLFQLLLYPSLDADFTRVSYQENAQGGILTSAVMRRFWDCYVPDRSQRCRSDISPLYAKTFAALPPALIITAEFDPLRDEAEVYALMMQVAGVNARSYCAKGMIHDFLAFPSSTDLAVVTTVWREIVSALQQVFGITSAAVKVASST